MIDLINDPWPWYIAGPLIGLFVPLLLLVGNKRFGVSSSFKHICAACLPIKKIDFFNYNWKDHSWNLFFVLGIIWGGFITSIMIDLDYSVLISDATKVDLTQFGITELKGLFPTELFTWEGPNAIRNIILLSIGGFLIGFGTRYANGCTSGHAIMGLSLLKIDSLIAVIGFFIGGLTMTHFIYTYIF